MKKMTKIILIALVCLTLICLAVLFVIMSAISGDKLFYFNSRLGYFYAVSFRPICFISSCLIIFWIIAAVKKRKFVLEKILSLKPKKKKLAVDEISSAAAQTAVSEEKTVFCSDCGKQLSSEKNFCPFCGKPIKSISKNN